MYCLKFAAVLLIITKHIYVTFQNDLIRTEQETIFLCFYNMVTYIHK